jgi:hypothetical protein
MDVAYLGKLGSVKIPVGVVVQQVFKSGYSKFLPQQLTTLGPNAFKKLNGRL